MRDAIAAALARCSSLCLDNEEERAEVCDAIVAAIAASPDASRIRHFFANAPTDGTRLAALHGSNGRHQSEVLNSAVRLALGDIGK